MNDETISFLRGSIKTDRCISYLSVTVSGGTRKSFFYLCDETNDNNTLSANYDELIAVRLT